MKTQKAIAITMILTSSVLTALVCDDIAYPAILCMLGLLGLQRRFTWDIKPERRVIASVLLLLLAMIFALHCRYASSMGHVSCEQAAAVAWQTIARYFLASMILILFLGPPQRLPPSLGLFHVAITISAGQILLLDDMYVAFRLLELLSVILVVLYAAAAHGPVAAPVPQRRWRTSGWLTLGVILTVAANSGWIAGSILYRHVEVLNYLPVWFWRASAAVESTTERVSLVGFATSGKLSNVLLIKGDHDQTPALSIMCDDSPGYLRARAFDVYRASEWHDLSHKEAVFPERNKPFSMYFVGRTNIFRLDETEASECKYMTIRHESGFADALFTRLGTSFLDAPLNVLLRDDNDIVYAPNLHGGFSYRVAYTQSAYQKPPTNAQIHRMLNVPTQLDVRVRRLARKIFAGCTTTSEKIDAVVNYFHTNYTYALGLDIPPGQDKLTHFLLEESAGYCEYFASGAAILLRLADVPTRYVTGFLVTERDSALRQRIDTQSGLWIARNMDAHAWAEAWDKEQNQWTIVEATAEEGLAAALDAEQSGRRHGGTGVLLGQLLESLYQYGLLGVLSWSFKSYGLLAGLPLLPALLGAGLWLALRRRYNTKNSQGRTQSPAARDPALVTLHKMLARMDRKVKAAGLRRHLSETLHAFSQRLRARESGDGLWTNVSDWYLQYANLRYRRTISSEQLQQIAHGLHNSL